MYSSAGSVVVVSANAVVVAVDVVIMENVVTAAKIIKNVSVILCYADV